MTKDDVWVGYRLQLFDPALCRSGGHAADVREKQ